MGTGSGGGVRRMKGLHQRYVKAWLYARIYSGEHSVTAPKYWLRIVMFINYQHRTGEPL